MDERNSGAPIVALDELIEHIRDGMKVAIPHDFNGMYSGSAMSATRALIRRGVRNLHLVGIPAGGFQADLLIGAGCVATMEAGSMFMSEYGMPPRFVQAFKDGTIVSRDATCPAIHAALQAGEKHIPFIPLRGILGADVVRHRTDWRVVDNPFGDNDPVLLVPAINPDVTLFHAPFADRHGNVWVGRRRELAVAAHAATDTLVTVERIFDGDLMDDENLATGTLSNVYVTAVCHQPKGAWPLSFAQDYAEDSAHMREYMELARTADGFRAYLERYVLEAKEAVV
jgi:glutaconate CoA-transferase subunit A